MENKKLVKLLQHDQIVIDEILNGLLKIEFSDNEDFYYFIRRLNILENDVFFTKYVNDIEYITILKKIFIQIDRKKYLFYEYKYKLISIISKIKDMYQLYNQRIQENEYNEKRDEEINICRESILTQSVYFSDELVEMDKEKEYFYIKLFLNKDINMFHLTRNNFLYYLKQFGKPFNFTPSNLENIFYDYIILDYKVVKGTDVDKIVSEFQDEAVVDYKIMKIEDNVNVYNIKFYYKTQKYSTPDPIFENFNIIDSNCYETLVDCYVNEQSNIDIIDKLFHRDFWDVDLVIVKRFDERESRIFVLTDIMKYNVDYFKFRITEILEDKKISDIIYKSRIDFSGLQLLEKIKEKYNVEYAGYNV